MSYDATYRFRRLFRGVPQAVDGFGEQALFYGESMRYIPNALTRYRKETVRLIAEMTMGVGALAIIGGTVGVATFLTLASGGVIAVQGYSSLGNIGIEALTGFLSAFLNVRIVAPVVAFVVPRPGAAPSGDSLPKYTTWRCPWSQLVHSKPGSARKRPGSLAALTAQLADMSLNVLDVAHHRSGTRLPVNSVEILVVVETRDDDHRREVLQAFRSSGYDVDIVE
mgnify:CR=1 FL=1